MAASFHWGRCAKPFRCRGLNRYTYCVGDPINQIDPSGQASWKWLSNLLGKIGGAVSNGIETVSQVTPTTALTRIGAVAEVVAVGTTIGAVAAGALGDESTAGILGWVAAGSGLGGIGLGVAGQAVSKGSRGGQDTGGSQGPTRGFKSVSPVGQPRPAKIMSHTASTTDDPISKIKVYEGADTLRNLIPNRIVNDQQGYPTLMPQWFDLPNVAGGSNYLVDSPIANVAMSREIDSVFSVIASKGDNLPIHILSGAHGHRTGKNWTKGKRRLLQPSFYDDDLADVDRFRKLLGNNGVNRDIQVYDLGWVTKDQFKYEIGEVQAHIVHAYCYSAADHKMLKTMGCSWPVSTYTL